MARIFIKLLPIMFLVGSAYGTASGDLSSKFQPQSKPAIPSKEEQLKDTLKRAKVLLDVLRENKWDRWSVPDHLLRVPAQDYAEDSFRRRPDARTFSISVTNPETYREVAFYSLLFVRRNIHKGNGPEGLVASPTGVYILAWKNGKIETGSVEDISAVAHPYIEDAYNFVFPGMKAYKNAIHGWYVRTDIP